MYEFRTISGGSMNGLQVYFKSQTRFMGVAETFERKKSYKMYF